jgi:hypothetical protein
MILRGGIFQITGDIVTNMTDGLRAIQQTSSETVLASGI